MKCAETGQFSRWRQHLHRKMYTNHSWWKGLVMSSVATTSWVKSNGTECQNGMFVCVGAENDFSTFRKITIFMMKVFLLTTNLSTTGVDEEQNKFETWWGLLLVCLTWFHYGRDGKFSHEEHTSSALLSELPWVYKVFHNRKLFWTEILNVFHLR